MHLANLLFYLSYGVVVLLMYIGVKNRSDNASRSPYWPISLGLVTAASFSFVLAGLTPIFFLSVANVSLIFSGLAIILFIRSWDSSNRKLDPRYFWTAYCVAMVGYEFLRIYASFGFRVYLITALVGGISLLGLVETMLSSSE